MNLEAINPSVLLNEAPLVTTEGGALSSFMEGIKINSLSALEGVLVQGHYSVAHFSSHLFTEFGVSLPQEIVTSVTKRKAEFLAGRYLAKVAIGQLAVSGTTEIKIGSNREPLWPKGVVGSISHNNDHAICVVSKANNIIGIGVDIETILDAATAYEIQENIHDKQELSFFLEAGLNENSGTSIIFSAKESFFKAVFNQVKEYFGFEYARVSRLCAEQKLLTLKVDERLVNKFGLKREYCVSYAYDSKCVRTLLFNER